MALPNLSNMLFVGYMRYIQSIHEAPEHRNPDKLIRHFMPLNLRIRAAWLSKKELTRFRADPFYYYLVARTRYYDQVIADAIADDVQKVVMVGCGSDTRSYRFKDLLCAKKIRVLECDQAEAITERQHLTRRWRHLTYIEHLAVDLNDGECPALERWIGEAKPKALVMFEGVSPYINTVAFRHFLRTLASRLASGSHVAYDFKIKGVRDDFGREGRTEDPFRLSTSGEEAAAFHMALGLQLEHMELSAELTQRLLPNLNGHPMFVEDGLLRLRVMGA
jgi:methyltransferase (TIGR00027 family)